MITITAPLTCQLEITDTCNLKCEHCYRFAFRDLKKQYKTSDKWNR